MIGGRAGEYVLGRSRWGEAVQYGSPVLVRVAVGDRICHTPAALPRLGAGRSPVVRVATQFGDALDFFFRIGHERDCSLRPYRRSCRGPDASFGDMRGRPRTSQEPRKGSEYRSRFPPELPRRDGQDRGFFLVRPERLTPEESEYLRAMAELGPGPNRPGGHSRQAWGEGNVRGSSPLRGDREGRICIPCSMRPCAETWVGGGEILGIGVRPRWNR